VVQVAAVGLLGSSIAGTGLWVDWSVPSAPWIWLGINLLGTAALMLFVWWQITLLGKVEVIASETDDRFRRLFDANPIGMVVATAGDYRFVRVNPAFAGMLGYHPDEMIGRVRDEFAAPDSQNMPPPVEVGVDPGWDTEDKHYFSKSGELVTARVRDVRLAPNAAGESLILKLVEDVTEQRKLEAMVQQSQKIDAIGQLTGGIAHDFNNLLGIIIGNLDLLKVLIHNRPEDTELIDEALAAALRGADLTRHLLAFARRQPLNPDRVAVNAQIRTTTRLLKRTLGERIRISLDLGPDLWPVFVDPVQLEACIINLATNARDAMPDGGVLTILTDNRVLDAGYAQLHSDVKPGDYAVIEISDSGIGMEPKILPRIFEPFFTTKNRGKGTGLGLSMVFGFLKQSGGHITAYSEPGSGTTFRIYLPRMTGDLDDRPVPEAGEPRRGDGETVLVVEDNAALRRVAVRQLTDLGYTVTEAESADAALAVLSRRQMALVFTDIVMPGDLDGFALARTVLTQWPDTKVLLTSGFPETRINGKLGDAAAAARLLGKPYRTVDLARVVREVLEA
jgi:PAS domain S-box-containing protein